MPVIGRLDRQVDDLIISPVSRRRRGDDEQPAPAPRGEEGARPRRPPREPSAPPQTPGEDESSGGPDELPVWLL